MAPVQLRTVCKTAQNVQEAIRSVIRRVCYVNTLESRHQSCSFAPLVVLENENPPSTSNDKGKSKSSTGNLPSSISGDDDEIQVNSDLLNAWMQRLQVLTVLVRPRCFSTASTLLTQLYQDHLSSIDGRGVVLSNRSQHTNRT